MKKIKLATFFVLLATSSAIADNSSGVIEAEHAIGCLTDQDYRDFLAAILEDEADQIDAMIGVSCVPIGGREYSTLNGGQITKRHFGEPSPMVTVQIRVTFGDDVLDLWTGEDILLSEW